MRRPVYVAAFALGCLVCACGTVEVEPMPDDDDGAMESPPDDDGGVTTGSFTLELSDRLFVRQGESASVKVSIERLDGFEGRVLVSLEGLPAGVSAEPIAIEPDMDRGSLTLEADPAAAQGGSDVALVGVAEDSEDERVDLAGRVLVAGKPGSLDLSFGNGGIVMHDLDWPTIGLGVAAFPNGSVVVTGTTGWDDGEAITVRLEENGELDELFGEQGAVYFDVGESTGGAVVLPRGDGILVGGWSTVSDGIDSWQALALFGYGADGAESVDFGDEGGYTATDLGKGFDTSVQQILASETGELLVVGGHLDENNVAEAYLLGYSERGEEDGLRMEWKEVWAYSGLSLGDGRILLSGVHKEDFWVARVFENGEYDPDFGGGAPVTTDFGGHDEALGAVHLKEADATLVVGYVYPKGGPALALARYDGGGALDATFGDGGKLVTGIPLSSQASNGVQLDAEQRIIVVGSVANSQNRANFAVVRLNTDGTPDASFGESGVSVVEFPDEVMDPESGPRGVAFDDAVRLLVTGSISEPGSEILVVARFWP